MNQLSSISEKRLASCHPDIITIFMCVLEVFDYSVFCGHRGELAQNEAVKKGLSKLSYPNSKHNHTPSMAIDAGPYFKELKNTNWDDYKAFALFAGHVLAVAKQLYIEGEIEHQLIWGGDWDADNRTDDQSFNDLPHFELTRRNVWSL